MSEDKQLICDLLLAAYHKTRGACDMVSLIYDEDTERVTAAFKGGGTCEINVACDSGVAMIYDIAKNLWK